MLSQARIPAIKTARLVNPYSRMVYDYPEHLLPEPSPTLLKDKRGKKPLGSGRLIVELGPGLGNFIVNLARENPGDHLVGFEIRYKRLVKAARKLEKAGLERVWLLKEKAENFPEYFPPHSVSQVYINFPDPWPKTSQWKKRLIGSNLLKRMEVTLKEGGTLHLKTDHSGYFLHILTLLNNRAGWQIEWFSNDLNRKNLLEHNYKTEFEQLFVNQRKAIFSLIAKKRLGTGMAPAPVDLVR